MEMLEEKNTNQTTWLDELHHKLMMGGLVYHYLLTGEQGARS